MKLVIIFGPQAVWKMTVGHALEKTTWLKLFHNHMTIELIVPLFWYGDGSPAWTKLVNEFRTRIFEEFSKTEKEWLIFTFVWAFNMKWDRDYIEKVSNIFKEKWADVYFVELEADVDERLKRNKTPHRLKHKPTKNNIEWTENEIKEDMKNYRLTSNPWEIKEKNYIRINNAELSADDVAKMIIDKFWL